MKPRKLEQTPQDDLFRLRLDQMLNQCHAMYKLGTQFAGKLPKYSSTIFTRKKDGLASLFG